MKIEKIFISFVLYTIVLNLVSCTNLNTNSKQTTGFDTQEVEDMETKNLSGVIPDELEIFQILINSQQRSKER